MKDRIAARNWAVAIFDTHAQAQQTVECLREAGFSMEGFSIVGRGRVSPDRAYGCYSAGGRIRYSGDAGACWATLWEQLSGWGVLAIPQIGQVMIAGPLGAWIAATFDNAAIFPGLTALGAALYSLGIPRAAIAGYEAAVRAGRLLAVIHGSAEDVSRGKAVLEALLEHPPSL